MKKNLNQIKKFIKKEYGKKCKDYSYLCCVCRVWKAFENLEFVLTDKTQGLLEELKNEPNKKRDKKRKTKRTR